MWMVSVVMINRLRGEMADREQRIQAWYWDRCNFEVRARFATQRETLTMILVAFELAGGAAF